MPGGIARMVRWLDGIQMKTLLWIAPFYKGTMETEALAKGYGLPGQTGPANGQNYPLVDLTNPAAKAYWQDGVAKLLRLGVAGIRPPPARADDRLARAHRGQQRAAHRDHRGVR